MRDRERLVSGATGAFLGFLIGIAIYLMFWLAPYVKEFPWYVALLLDAFIPWLLAPYGYVPSIFIILIPTAVGGVAGIVLKKTPIKLLDSDF